MIGLLTFKFIDEAGKLQIDRHSRAQVGMAMSFYNTCIDLYSLFFKRHQQEGSVMRSMKTNANSLKCRRSACTLLQAFPDKADGSWVYRQSLPWCTLQCLMQAITVLLGYLSARRLGRQLTSSES
jgi:hypothetical protein